MNGSIWKDIRIGVLRGSLLGPLMLSIYLNNIFMFIERMHMCNYACDAIVFACHPNIDANARSLLADGAIVAKWVSDNSIELNDDKCHLMMDGDNYTNATVAIGK